MKRTKGRDCTLAEALLRPSERILGLFADLGIIKYSEGDAGALAGLKVLDFMIAPGKVSAKVINGSSRLEKVEIIFNQIPHESWLRVFDNLAQEALFLAKLLAGRIPIETESAFSKAGVSLFPASVEEVNISVNCQDGQLSPAGAAVILTLSEWLENNPFAIFTLRGKGRDECMTEIRKRRFALRNKDPRLPLSGHHPVHYEPTAPLASTAAYFWSAGKKIKELSYSLKADELPASIFQRLDPMPLDGIEDYVQPLFEDAYAHIARRAQAFALGIGK